MSKIISILKDYKSTTLPEMDEVALMERVDEKFTISFENTISFFRFPFCLFSFSTSDGALVMFLMW